MDVSTDGNNRIITETYYKHVDMVYRICLMFLRNVPDTEDAVQNVFLKFIQAGKNFADPEHEKAWLIETRIYRLKKKITGIVLSIYSDSK